MSERAKKIVDLEAEAAKAKQADSEKQSSRGPGCSPGCIYFMEIFEGLEKKLAERKAWSEVAAESNKQVDAYLREVDPELPEHYGMPVDGVRRVVVALQKKAEAPG